MNRILILFSLLVIYLMPAFAQQDPMFNKYMFNPLVLNPAYAGSRDAFSAVILHRSQWVGFEGAPATQTASIHAPFWRNKIGLGLSVMRDKIGPTTSTSIMGAYAYRIKVGKGKLGFGLRTAVYNYSYDWSKIEYKDGTDNSAILSADNYWVPSFDFGLWYHTNVLYTGFALSHINQPTIATYSAGTTVNDIQYGSTMDMHAAFTFGYAIELTDNMVLKPSCLIKSSGKQTPSGDFNVSVLTNKVLWLGITVRTNKGMVAMVEYNFTKNIRAGYSFDFSAGPLRNQSAGSHELFVGIDFNPLKSKTLSPRYF